MPNNYVLLEKITVGAAGAASVTFANIPQTGYTDLVLKTSARTSRSAIYGEMFLRFNGSTTNYSAKALEGTGSAAGSYSETSIRVEFNGDTSTANTFGNAEFYIPNYTSANFKSVSLDSVTENNATAVQQFFKAQLWSDTSAITQIAIGFGTGTISANSTFYLYGVAKLGTTPAIAPKAAGGDIVMTDGTYWYHAFRSSGTFTPALNLSCDVLQVAGGGGGGSRSGGGGGAGGISYLASQSLSITNYTVTVGAGGTPGSRSVNGTNGSNSQFASLTLASGGGVGASAVGNLYGTAGNSGGSGGGGANNGSGGAGTSGQGFAGGSSNSSSYDAAGGGGAGAVGANASTGGAGSGAGAGGAGVNTYSTWLNTTGTGVSGYIAGGGGGGSYGSSNHGAGGSGGGGAGADSAPTAGTANTGGGGGGAGNSANTNTTPTGAAGGSGIVIVRYLVA
jgi:hypothetical protein